MTLKMGIVFWLLLITFIDIINPLTARSDEHLISPHNITPEPQFRQQE